MEKLYAKYIKAHESKWSETTVRSEGFRLKGVTLTHIKEPARLYKFLQDRGLSQYAIKTAFLRASHFSDWLVAEGHLKTNEVKHYYNEHSKKFKHVYAKKPVNVTFADAVNRINQIDVADIREKALQLLMTGMRFGESMSLNKDGQVVGKGNIVRTVPLADQFSAAEFKKTYGALHKQLKKVGLTAHMLRKICATEHAKQGATEADLMSIFGWRTSNMAHLYVQAQRTQALTDTLVDKLKKARKK